MNDTSNHYLSVTPAALNVSDYLSGGTAPEAKVVKLVADLSTYEGQRPVFKPDLTQILDSKGLPFSFEGPAPAYEVLSKDPVVYFRDNLETDSGYPHNGPVSNSPDIILKQNPAANYQSTFTTDASAGDYELSDDAEFGQPNYLYLRAYNRGATDAPANTLKGTVYWAPASTLPTPDDWHLIGTEVFDQPVKAARAQLSVAREIRWNSVPHRGKYCFIATLVNAAENPSDFKDSLASQMSSMEDYYRVVRDNNRVTWRNFHVVDEVHATPLPPKPAPNPLLEHRQFPFLFPGLPGKKTTFKLEVIQRLPFDVPVVLDISEDLLEVMPGWEKMKHEKIKNQVRFEARKNDVVRFPIALKLSSLKTPPMVWLQVPRMPKPFKGRHFLVVRELWDGREIGRITWIFIWSREKDIPRYHRMYWWQQEKIAQKQKLEGKKAK